MTIRKLSPKTQVHKSKLNNTETIKIMWLEYVNSSCFNNGNCRVAHGYEVACNDVPIGKKEISTQLIENFNITIWNTWFDRFCEKTRQLSILVNT